MPETGVGAAKTQKYRRLDVQLPARISTLDAETDLQTGRACFRASEEVCQNVSRGGAYVVTEEPLRPGCRLLLEIDLPDGGSVQAIGRVRWSRARLSMREAESQSGIGIEFLGGAPEHLSALEQYVSAGLRRSRPSAADATVTPAAGLASA